MSSVTVGSRIDSPQRAPPSPCALTGHLPQPLSFRAYRKLTQSYINVSPDGQEGLYTALAESNVPLGLISNSHRREWIQRYRRPKQK